MFIKRMAFLSILLVTMSLLPANKLSLGAEATYFPTLLTIGDSTSLLSDAGISLSISYEAERFCYSSSFSFDKGWEYL